MTAHEIRAAFDYDPMTGALERKDPSAKRRAHTGTVNHRKDTSYAVLCLNGKKLYAHRAAWMHANGDIPEGMVIDHIDGNGLNNRLTNLRVVTKSINQRNRRIAITNRTGVTGVTHHKNGFSVSCGGAYIGHFANLIEAVAARRAAEPIFGYIQKESVNHANS